MRQGVLLGPFQGRQSLTQLRTGLLALFCGWGSDIRGTPKRSYVTAGTTEVQYTPGVKYQGSLRRKWGAFDWSKGNWAGFRIAQFWRAVALKDKRRSALASWSLWSLRGRGSLRRGGLRLEHCAEHREGQQSDPACCPCHRLSFKGPNTVCVFTVEYICISMHVYECGS